MNKLSQYKETNCTCQKCISFCKIRPGWFRPSQIPKLVKFLKMPLEKVFTKYLIIDYWIGDDDNIYVLSPVKDFDWVMKFGNERDKEMMSLQLEHNKFMGRGDYDRSGSKASWGYAFLHAPCIFLENDRCKVYPVKPFECAVAWHEMNQEDNVRELIAKEWKQEKSIEKMLEDL